MTQIPVDTSVEENAFWRNWRQAQLASTAVAGGLVYEGFMGLDAPKYLPELAMKTGIALLKFASDTTFGSVDKLLTDGATPMVVLGITVGGVLFWGGSRILKHSRSALSSISVGRFLHKPRMGWKSKAVMGLTLAGVGVAAYFGAGPWMLDQLGVLGGFVLSQAKNLVTSVDWIGVGQSMVSGTWQAAQLVWNNLYNIRDTLSAATPVARGSLAALATFASFEIAKPFAHFGRFLNRNFGEKQKNALHIAGSVVGGVACGTTSAPFPVPWKSFALVPLVAGVVLFRKDNPEFVKKIQNSFVAVGRGLVTQVREHPVRTGLVVAGVVVGGGLVGLYAAMNPLAGLSIVSTIVNSVYPTAMTGLTLAAVRGFSGPTVTNAVAQIGDFKASGINMLRRGLGMKVVERTPRMNAPAKAIRTGDLELT